MHDLTQPESAQHEPTDRDDMTDWSAFAGSEPDLAAAVLARFQFTKHHVLATLRRDGAPRVSGTEVPLVDGQLYLGSMPGALKARDLQRDGRYALHSNPGDGSMAGGDAKLSGVALEVVDPDEVARIAEALGAPPGPLHLFRLGLDLVVWSNVDEERQKMTITSWRPGRGVVVEER